MVSGRSPDYATGSWRIWTSCRAGPEKVKLMQKNWIGRSEGAEVTFKIDGFEKDPQTLHHPSGYALRRHLMVLAPEHPYVRELIEGTEYQAEAEAFMGEAAASQRYRPEFYGSGKEGCFIGRYAVNPLNGKDSDLYRQLCPDGLRYRRDYGKRAGSRHETSTLRKNTASK